MPLHGQLKRAFPRVEVLRGYNPNEPHTLTQSHPAHDGIVIASGQVISLTWSDNKYGWVLGCSAAHTPYIALQDWDKSQRAGLGQFGYDPDVMEAGKLTGLSCAGQFEIQSAYFVSDTYAMDNKLTYVATGVTTQNASEGYLKIATTGDPVVGFITRPTGQNSPNSLDRINSNVTFKQAITWTTAYDENPVI